MPLILSDRLPAIDFLKDENIDVAWSKKCAEATHSLSRPIKLVILNLMPTKIATETDFLRVMTNSPLLIDITLMAIRNHTSKNTPQEHIDHFYTFFDEVRGQHFDALIVTGAPLEMIPFEAVDYWQELTDIFSWAETHCRTSLFICWAAQAALYFHFGITKHCLPMKKFGIFQQTPLCPSEPIFRGFDDKFMMPHSRHTFINSDDIRRQKDLIPLAEDQEGEISIAMAREGRRFYVTGHLEYAADTLDTEYHRDLGKRDDVSLPVNYYTDDDSTQAPLVTWRSAANLFYHNWLSHYTSPTADAE